MHKRHFKYSWLFKALFAERACCLLLIILAQGWDKFAGTQCHTSNSPFQIKAPWVRGESGPLVPGESLKLKCSSHLQELPSLAWTAILIDLFRVSVIKMCPKVAGSSPRNGVCSNTEGNLYTHTYNKYMWNL